MSQGVDRKVDVTVVVGGRAVEVTVNRRQTVEKLIKEALREAKLHGADPDEWDLRFESGQMIDRAQIVAAAGIDNCATLFLDPHEGGGGNAPALVPPEVSRAKLEPQLADWHANAEVYRRRGQFLVAERHLSVDVAFAARVPVGQPPGAFVVPLCVEIDFANYDIWAPSVRFIDLLTREPAVPAVQAREFRPGGRALAPGEPPEDSLLAHPDTGRPFLCQQGVREYHEHPQHDGDSWLLHRTSGKGTLAGICGQIWRLTTRTVVALTVQGVSPSQPGLPGQLGFVLAQGDLDAFAEQVAAARAAAEPTAAEAA